MAVRKLGDVAVGTIAKIKVNGSFMEFIIANQESTRTALIYKDVLAMGTAKFDSGSTNIQTVCLQLYNQIDAEIKEYIISFSSIYGSNVSVPSNEQVGGGWSYFNSNERRIAYYEGQAEMWWTSSREFGFGNPGVVMKDGEVGLYTDAGEECGIRPFFYLDPNLFMLDDGTIITNQPPTAPASITASNVMGGQEATVTLGAASDSDGQIINYTYERQVDSGSWTQFASENSLTVTDQIDDSWTTVAYRARAMDDKGAEGPYATSQTYTVVHNLPPTAPGSIQVTNVTTGQEATVTLTAATDPDGTVESYIYERSIDGAEFQPFANVNSLTQTDHISGDWGTVAYRACAVDDDGAAGPYVTSETKTVTTGLVTIAGPAADLGEKPMPFAFWFRCGVSDQTAVQDIAVRVTVDGKDFFNGTLDSGAAKGLYIDTRFRAAGQHTIAVTASKEDYQPAAASYTFTVPSVVLPYEGRAEMPQNSAGQPVWWYGLARFIFGPDGKDLITLMQEMQAASPKMVTGSYQGTGQAGSSNPNTLAAGFRPRVVLLSSGYSIDIMIVATESGSTGTVEAVNYTLSDTGVSWYASSAAAQGNESGKTYRYVIFG